MQGIIIGRPVEAGRVKLVAPEGELAERYSEEVFVDESRWGLRAG